jgi:hypothetical protein
VDRIFSEGALVRLRTKDLASRQVGDDVMVLDLATSQYFSVGGSGLTILDVLGRGETTPDAIVAEILAVYAVDEDRARRDVGAFLDRLDAAGLLVDDGPAGPASA